MRHSLPLPNWRQFNIGTRLRVLRTFAYAHRRAIIRYGLVGLLLAFIAMSATAKLSSERYAHSIQTARTNLQHTQDDIRSILTPKQIELGQQDLSVDYLLSQTNPHTFTLPRVTTPPRIMVFINLLPATHFSYSSLVQAERIDDDVTALTSYQYSVITSIESVLEYNPRAEFADKTLNEEEIKLRISNAKKGLADAYERLKNIQSNKIGDFTKTDVLNQITSLQKQLEQFSSKRDYEAWYKTVETAQKSIVANRQAFWQEETDKLFYNISEVNQHLATIEQALRN